jgi:hypothetical protein
MIISAQMRAAGALLGIDQHTLAGMADVSLPTTPGWKRNRELCVVWLTHS